jgi:phosphatidate phosphatase PAH1
VIEPGTPIFVADIDGTLTTSDTETWTSLLTGSLPENWPSSPEALSILASKGLRPFYLTARPEWLDGRSREFLAADGYPPGVMHTTLDFLGATGAAAATYKTAELEWVTGKGATLEWSFGNSDTDAQAYEAAGIQPVEHRIYIGLDSPTGGGRVIAGYDELLAEFEALPSSCTP